MQPQRYQIRFPVDDLTRARQDEAYFTIVKDGVQRRIGFHDYAEIYRHPGLYEQLYYQRLKCSSPARLSQLLHQVVRNAGEHPARLRVLDVGAGNGMVGEILAEQGTARLVGVDLIDEARRATERDRPGIYDRYYVADLSRLSRELLAELRGWNFNAMTSVAALGFGDIPVAAFVPAFNLVANDGWIAFNIRESFLNATDTSGFAQLVRRLLHGEYFKLHHFERYCHRLSIEGNRLYYNAVIGRKRRDIDDACLAEP